ISFHKDALTIPGEMVLKTILQLQTVVGALVNVIHFLYSIFPILLGHKKISTYVILTHMTVANLLVLLALGILHTMATFVSKNPLSSLGCKVGITYGERLAAPPCAPPAS
uniref:Vomeronasal type-1 receptor n=1 Tax=Moschus moschiferus TaxID=68415 RepID=A0A8C6E535_MOSMO